MEHGDLDDQVIAYAGATGFGSIAADLRADTSQVRLTDSTIRQSRQNGIYAPAASFNVTRTTFDHNAATGLFLDNPGSLGTVTLQTTSLQATGRTRSFSI